MRIQQSSAPKQLPRHLISACASTVAYCRAWRPVHASKQHESNAFVTEWSAHADFYSSQHNGGESRGTSSVQAAEAGGMGWAAGSPEPARWSEAWLRRKGVRHTCGGAGARSQQRGGQEKRPFRGSRLAHASGQALAVNAYVCILDLYYCIDSAEQAG